MASKSMGLVQTTPFRTIRLRDWRRRAPLELVCSPESIRVLHYSEWRGRVRKTGGILVPFYPIPSSSSYPGTGCWATSLSRDVQTALFPDTSFRSPRGILRGSQARERGIQEASKFRWPLMWRSSNSTLNSSRAPPPISKVAPSHYAEDTGGSLQIQRMTLDLFTLG